MHNLALVRSTYGKESDAENAAARLIDKRLAACVHVAALTSTYRWKAKTVREKEWMLEARCLPADVNAVWGALLDGHPYDTPLVEVAGEVAVPARYMAWATEATKRAA